ncbi:MAG: nucleotidyltransferase domain-containing protein [Candidatus Saccharibacteria bacterium]
MTLFDIIQKILPDVQTIPEIHAMWLEGSWATGRNNEHSDIDVWLDIEDGAFVQCIDAFRNTLLKVGAIDWEKSRGIYSTDPKLQKHTFHLRGFPEEQVIELDLQEHSRNFVFSKKEHTIKILFDRDATIKWAD